MKHSISVRDGGTYDLVVVGGGMAGVCCAIAAARRGLRCILLEKEGCVGGTATVSGVMHLLGGRRFDAASNRMVREVGGLFDEITDELIAVGAAVDPDTIDVHHFNPYGWYPRMAAGIACDVDKLKWHLEHKCIQAGVHLRYCTTVVDVTVQDGRIEGVITHGKEGFTAYKAMLVADCTGDADVATQCGCPVEKGRAEDGGMCPATLVFYVDHVDTKAYVDYQNAHASPKLVEIIERLRREGVWTYPFEIFISIETPQSGVFMVNTSRQIDVDGTDGDSLTSALIEGRNLAYELLAVMRAHFPGFHNAQMRRVFDRMGIRETRRILARQMITLADAVEGRRYADCVASTTYNFDLPDPKRPSFDPMMGDAKTPDATRKHTRIEIPYGALLPQGIDNLIVAGRCLGAEREVMGACRVMGPCAGMGQAAGYAASFAMADRSFGRVSPDDIRKTLAENGCIGI